MDTIYSIIPKDERQMVIEAIGLVEEKRFDEAIEECSRILNGGYSAEAEALSHYAVGFSLSYQFAERTLRQPEDVDTAIHHYELCLKRLEFADAYVMLGYALMQKMGLLRKNPVDLVHYYSQLLDLALRAVAAFDKGHQLDARLWQYATEWSTYLEPIIARSRATLAAFDQKTFAVTEQDRPRRLGRSGARNWAGWLIPRGR